MTRMTSSYWMKHLNCQNDPNEVLFFSDGYDAPNFIRKTDVKPFLYELRKMIHPNGELNIRCIPYLFFTSGATKKSVLEAYAMSAQGFFINRTA